MNKQQLAGKIWAAANEMRSKIEASEYKDYILGFIFYKFLSEQEEAFLHKQGASEEDIKTISESYVLREEEKLRSFGRSEQEVNEIHTMYVDTVKLTQNALGYFIDHENLFSSWIAKGSDFSVGDVTDALNAFDRLISPTHQKVFSDIFKTLKTGLSKLGDNTSSQTKAVRELIHLIKIIPMDNKQGYDVLGYIYEYLISNFAANAGKKAGEFYTPHEVSLLMSEIIADHLKDCKEIKIYDPTSGSGSLLINIGQSVAKQLNDKNNIRYYAQELKENTYNLTRMNLVMRGILPDNIVTRCGDTLEDDWPFFEEVDGRIVENSYEPLTNLDAVVSNPPYSQKWDPSGKKHDPRFNAYGIAPKTKADYAFLLHDLYHLRAGGIMTIVLPHGVLFRGGEEGEIRKNLIENNNIDAIIGLPANIFFGTSIPTIIMVLKKDRKENDVLIIDASKGYTKEGKNNLLRARDIKKITDTYVDRLEIEGFSRKITRNQIRDNDYNLNIPRYVDSSENPESYDIYATMFGGIPKSELSALESAFTAFPSLRGELFTESDTPYVNIKASDVKSFIETNSDVLLFENSFEKAFESFPGYLDLHLIKSMESVIVPREESEIAGELFKRLEGIPMLDKYAAYQILDDNWQIIATDLEMIQTEGRAAINQVDPNMVIKKKDGKEIEVQLGWSGHILPFGLVQKLFLPDDLSEISAIKDSLSEIAAEYEEIVENMPEDGRSDYLNEENTALDLKAIEKEGKQLVKKNVDIESCSVEEYVARAYNLIMQEKKLKNKLKGCETALHNNTKKLIESMSMQDAEKVLTAKWIDPITCGIASMPGLLVCELEKQVNALATKYSITMLDIKTQIAQSEKALCSMIDELSGSEFDLKGLNGLMHLLGGTENE